MRRSIILVAAIFLIQAAPAMAAGPAGDLEQACPTGQVDMRKVQKLLAACETFVAEMPAGDSDYADGLAARANLELQSIQAEAALKSAGAALAIAPDHRLATTVKVEALFRLGRFAEARDDMARLLTADPNDARVRRDNAQLLTVIGTPEQALAAIEGALAVLPQDLQLRQQRADFLVRLDRPDEALEALDGIIADVPNYALALAARATLRFRGDQYEAAEADLAALRETPLWSGEYALLMARIALRLGDLEAALEAIEEAIVDPRSRQDEPTVLLYRYAILDRLHRPVDADAALSAFKRETQPQFVLRVQVFLRNVGMNDVEITGELDETTRRELVACITRSACGGQIAKFI